jgi:hypothetical protein
MMDYLDHRIVLVVYIMASSGDSSMKISQLNNGPRLLNRFKMAAPLYVRLVIIQFFVVCLFFYSLFYQIL